MSLLAQYLPFIFSAQLLDTCDQQDPATLPPPSPALSSAPTTTISNLPPEIVLAIFEFLPELKICSGTAAINRSAVLGVSRLWQEIGGRALSHSLDFTSDGDNRKKVESWVAYSNLQLKNGHPKPFLVKLRVFAISTILLDNLGGIDHLLVEGAVAGSCGLVSLSTNGHPSHTCNYDPLSETRSLTITSLWNIFDNHATVEWSFPRL